MPSLSVPSTRRSFSTTFARAIAALRESGRPKTPTAQEYWGNPNASVRWWKAL